MRYLPPSGTAGLARSFVNGKQTCAGATAHDDGERLLGRAWWQCSERPRIFRKRIALRLVLHW